MSIVMRFLDSSLASFYCIHSRIYSRIWSSRQAYLIGMCLLFVQRSPLVRTLLSLRHEIPSRFVQILRVGIPVAVAEGASHALSGATEVVPLNGFANPAEVKAGEDFTWAFTTLKEKPKSYTVAGLPAGLHYDDANNNRGVSFFNGTPTTPGHYTVEIIGWRKDNGKGSNTPTYRLALTVLPGVQPDPYRQWAETSGLGPGAVADLLADPDSDDVVNLLEYAFNLNGAERDRHVVDRYNGHSGLPLVELTRDGENSRWRLTFMRRLTDARLSYRIEVSDDLANWKPWAGTPGTVTVDDQWERCVAEDAFPDAWPQGYVRVLVGLSQ